MVVIYLIIRGFTCAICQHQTILRTRVHGCARAHIRGQRKFRVSAFTFSIPSLFLYGLDCRAVNSSRSSESPTEYYDLIEDSSLEQRYTVFSLESSPFTVYQFDEERKRQATRYDQLTRVPANLPLKENRDETCRSTRG